MRPPDVLRLVTLGAIWGASFLLIEVALDGFTPLQIVFGRIAVGAATLLVMLAVLRVRLPRDRSTWAALGVLSLVANVFPFLLITWGQQYITSGMGSILNSTTPLFTAAFAVAALETERMNAVRAAGVILGFVGAAIIVGGGAGGNVAGQLAVVSAAAFYGVGFVFNRKYVSARVDPGQTLALPAIQLSLAALVLLPLVSVDAASTAPRFELLPTLSVLGLGALGTGYAFYLAFRLIRDVGATSASFVTYLIPVFGVFLGWWVLDERIGLNAFVGAAVVIAGITVAERGAATLRRQPGSGAPGDEARAVRV